MSSAEGDVKRHIDEAWNTIDYMEIWSSEKN